MTVQSDQAIYEFAQRVMFAVRKDRSEKKQPLKFPITRSPFERCDSCTAIQADRGAI
jgi:hypothetical protein